MAFATYTAATNDFRVTTGFTNNSDYIFYNNTKAALIVSFPNGGVDNSDEFVLGPGECWIHHQTAATLASAANNVNARPAHTAVGVEDVVDLAPHKNGENRVNESQARFVVSSF